MLKNTYWFRASLTHNRSKQSVECLQTDDAVHVSGRCPVTLRYFWPFSLWVWSRVSLRFWLSFSRTCASETPHLPHRSDVRLGCEPKSGSTFLCRWSTCISGRLLWIGILLLCVLPLPSVFVHGCPLCSMFRRHYFQLSKRRHLLGPNNASLRLEIPERNFGSDRERSRTEHEVRQPMTRLHSNCDRPLQDYEQYDWSNSNFGCLLFCFLCLRETSFANRTWRQNIGQVVNFPLVYYMLGFGERMRP